jgi:hypothetical protein
MLRRTLGLNGKEMAGGWKSLYEELRNLYASRNINITVIKWRMRWAGYVARIVEMRKAYKILVGIPERKRPLERLARIKVKAKVKVKLSLCLTKHHVMKAYWEWRYSSTHSLTSALD